LIPEAAALGYTPDLALAWAVTSVTGSMGLVAAGSIALALPLSRLRGRTWLVTVVLLATVVAVRGELLVADRRTDAARDAATQRLVGHELMAGMAVSLRRLTVRGDVRELSSPLRGLKWIPEVPEPRRRFDVPLRPKPVAAYGLDSRSMGVQQGRDPAFWTMASIRCELRLGLPRDPAGRCRVPAVADRSTPKACVLDLVASPPEMICPEPPEALAAGATRDPRARGWAALALLVLCLVGYLGDRGVREAAKA
jgi:hypothetical protein